MRAIPQRGYPFGPGRPGQLVGGLMVVGVGAGPQDGDRLVRPSLPGQQLL